MALTTVLWFPIPEGALSILWWPDDFQPETNWLHKSLQCPRTIRGWWREVEALRQPMFAPPADIGFALPTQSSTLALYATAAEFTEAFLTKNMRLRWICRKWLHRVRRRCMDRRVHGAEGDLVLCEPIPPADCVSVYDLRSRSRYHFHVSTIHKIFVEALSYQSYGIACPQYPKNPYTNLPWSLGQTIVLVAQIQARIWSAKHTFVNPLVYTFRCAGYCLEGFERAKGRDLQVLAAKRYFSEVEESVEVRTIYMEVFEDILELLEMPTKRLLYEALRQRHLSAALLKEWDAIILAFWMFQNHTFLHHPCFTSVLDMVVSVKDLMQRCMVFLAQQRPQRPIVRARRRPNTGIQPDEVDEDGSSTG